MLSFFAGLIKPLTYISPIIFAAYFTSSTGRYYVRLGMYIGCLSVVGTASSFIALGMSLVGKMYDVNHIVASSFYYVASRVLDITIEVEGEEHLQTRPAVMIGNHQSMLDIIWLGRIFPKQASIMAKKSIQLNPVLGPFMNMSGTVFIDRGNSAKAHRSLEAAGEGMKTRRTSLFIFAEGTRHSEETPTLLPFKKGAFHLAVQGGIPLVPVVCENYWRLYRKGVFGSGTIKIKVLPPVPTAGLTTEDVSALTTRVRDQMLSALCEISVKVPSGEPEKSDDSKASPGPSVRADLARASTANERSEAAPSPLPVATLNSDDTSSTSGSEIRKEGSENGAETEEDEGMVLVGRPQ